MLFEINSGQYDRETTSFVTYNNRDMEKYQRRMKQSRTTNFVSIQTQLWLTDYSKVLGLQIIPLSNKGSFQNKVLATISLKWL